MARIGLFIFLAILTIFLCVSMVGIIVRIMRYIGSSIAGLLEKSAAPSQNDSQASGSPSPEGSSGCLYGSCEICGQKFTGTSSSPDNCLRMETYNFYGRRRNRLICDKCFAILRKEQNFRDVK